MTNPVRVLHRHDFQHLLNVLTTRGYRVVGPTVRDGAIVYDDIHAASDLPEGWTDRQDGGTYRLERRNDAALFGYNVGPHSWKKFLFPPRTRLWQADRQPEGFTLRPEPLDAAPYAFLGVRSCELHAIAIQDTVFMDTDPHYRAHRERAFLVAVNCGQAGGTCFCVSMNTGPRAESGFDLALTEILEDGRHAFTIEAGSERGREVLEMLPAGEPVAADVEASSRCTERAIQQMGRSMDIKGVPELLARNLEHPRWDDVASRCLACANCTMACPTCFCSTVEDTTDLTGDHAERWRSWDSCFTMDFSHVHGGSVRSSAKARYRQWLTHKLSTWHDQFGSSGCVGCGRCITWCPVAIDLTREVAAIRESEGADGNHP
ncbi:MAG: 4Fe-4S dicluster domain-containing protein [Vicinamibacterales bacterium]